MDRRVIITTVVIVIWATVCTITITETLRGRETGCVQTGAETCTRASHSAFDAAYTGRSRRKYYLKRMFQITVEGTVSDTTLGLDFSTGTRKSFRPLPPRRRSKRPRNNKQTTAKERRKETKETMGNRTRPTMPLIWKESNNNIRVLVIDT